MQQSVLTFGHRSQECSSATTSWLSNLQFEHLHCPCFYHAYFSFGGQDKSRLHNFVRQVVQVLKLSYIFAEAVTFSAPSVNTCKFCPFCGASSFDCPQVLVAVGRSGVTGSWVRTKSLPSSSASGASERLRCDCLLAMWLQCTVDCSEQWVSCQKKLNLGRASTSSVSYCLPLTHCLLIIHKTWNCHKQSRPHVETIDS